MLKYPSGGGSAATVAASPLVPNTEIPKLLKDWSIFESIELLAQNTNQVAISFDTNMLIGGKVYTIIEAGPVMEEPKKYSPSIKVKYWTIELLENVKSIDPVAQIKVYGDRDGTLSA